MAKVEAATRLAIQMIESFNHHNIDMMSKIFSDDMTQDDFSPFPSGETYTGKSDVLKYYESLFQKYPDASLETEELFGYGNRCVLRWKQRWHPEEPSFRGLTILSVRDDKIIEIISYAKH